LAPINPHSRRIGSTHVFDSHIKLKMDLSQHQLSFNRDILNLQKVIENHIKLKMDLNQHQLSPYQNVLNPQRVINIHIGLQTDLNQQMLSVEPYHKPQ
jgi:predicted RNA-binding protein